MTKKDAVDFLARNPKAKKLLTHLASSGFMHKLDCAYLSGQASNEADTRVNLTEVFNALGKMYWTYNYFLAWLRSENEQS